MSDKKDNYLTKEEQEQALKWIKKKWKKENACCEVCGDKDWQLSRQLTTPLAFSFNFDGSIYPTISAICRNCGNTKYFNALVMGLVEGDKDGGKE